jgi:cell division protein FtsB
VPGAKSPEPGGTARRVPSDRVRRRRTTVKLSLVALVLVGFLFVFVYPTRTFLQQRDQTNSAQQRLELLRRQTKRLQQETKKLKGNAEVERLARERFGLVRPGETPYVIVPTPTTTAAPGSASTSPTTAGQP